MPQQHPVGQGLLTIETSQSQSDTPQSVGLLWTSDQPDAEPSDNTQHSQQTPLQPAGFEPIIPGSGRLQTRALDRAVTGIGHYYYLFNSYLSL